MRHASCNCELSNVQIVGIWEAMGLIPVGVSGISVSHAHETSYLFHLFTKLQIYYLSLPSFCLSIYLSFQRDTGNLLFDSDYRNVALNFNFTITCKLKMLWVFFKDRNNIHLIED